MVQPVYPIPPAPQKPPGMMNILAASPKVSRRFSKIVDTMMGFCDEKKSWWRLIWWRYMPGTKIKVKWPTGWAMLKLANGDKNYVESSDPNQHYRPWLEKNVGRQGWDWDWALTHRDLLGDERLTIKFRKGKEKYATLTAINWS